ncbi:MAG: EF-P lysine aminoacylase GenX [Kangiellaceae bacterium]|nr:EF-P lysine aminoacylase GenX [Kangiellaceae bacterium]
MNWQPTTSTENLKARAHILAQIRDYFTKQKVVEVETPLLCSHGVTDRYMRSLISNNFSQGIDNKGFLQTSPEYAMKRLLASGSGDIYQICKAFRQDEVGRRHNPEFTMLEWYRVGFDDRALMDDVFALLSMLKPNLERVDFSYQQVFEQFLQIDPLAILDTDLKVLAEQMLGDLPQDLERDDYLSLLFEAKIEPHLGLETDGHQSVAFIYDFPASQAALARLNEQDPRVAKRFEVYWQGVELANGFYELIDAELQLERFEADNQWRETNNLEAIAIDHYFIDALRHGLPDCAGVALGVDRLMMILLEAKHIEQVIAFPADRA